MNIKPVPKVQAAINWGALATLSLGVIAAFFPEEYSRLPPTFEGAFVLFISSFAGWLTADVNAS